MIVAGFGFRKDASLGSLTDAFERACVDVMPECIAAPDDKAIRQVFRLFSEEIGVPVRSIPADLLEQQSTVTQSLKSIVERNIGSVAEAAALAAAGPGAQLMTARHISADKLATCALAVKEKS
ncbi:cobalamin biosynthesis protein [uncultured Roseobacter sp.]|uniref:cobalamin biosynthesis protein n=1 Tax=uncultured Roseobacter sp. TaxID=114847 RepID=UPI0026276D5B|nr:cobalamin biosynthesis protein [uncultured Roseobacter sp.]